MANDAGEGKVEFRLNVTASSVVPVVVLAPVLVVVLASVVGLLAVGICAALTAVQITRRCRHDRKVWRVVELSDADTHPEPKYESRRHSVDSHIYHEPSDVSANYANDTCVTPDDYLIPLPVRNVLQGQGQMPPDCPQPSISNEDTLMLSTPTEFGPKLKTSEEAFTQKGSSRQRSQPPSTSRPYGQEASFPTGIITGRGFKKLSKRFSRQSGPQPMSAELVCHQPTNDPEQLQYLEHPPRKCGQQKSAQKHSLKMLDDTTDLEFLSLLKNKFGPEAHITDLKLENKKLHVSLQLNLEQVSTNVKQFGRGSHAIEGRMAPPDDYLNPVVTLESAHDKHVERSYVNAWSSGTKETTV